jgi:integrase
MAAPLTEDPQPDKNEPPIEPHALTSIGRLVVEGGSLKADGVLRHHTDGPRSRALGAWADPDLVFTDPLGAPLSPHQLVHQFHAAVRRADLGHVRWHDLRHTCASLALAAGTPVHVVAQRLGHSSATTTLAIYAHCLPHQQAEAGQTLDALVYGPRT